MFIINNLFNMVFKSAWGGAKAFYRGARGTRKVTNFVTMEEEEMNPAQQIKNRLAKHQTEALTGYKFHDNGKVEDVHIDAAEIAKNKMEGQTNTVLESVFGAPITMLGWGARKAVTGGGKVSRRVMPKMARGVGHLTKQTMDEVGDTAINAVGFAHDLTKSRTGQLLLFGAPVGLAAGLAGFHEDLHRVEINGLRGQYGNALANPWGSVEDNSDQALGSFDYNADGSLVFALHNLR